VRLKQWRLAQLQGQPGFAFQQYDIRERDAFRSLFERQPFAAVINLAARAGVRPSVADPWIYFETNVTGALNLLDLCRNYGVSKFVQASSSSVYGDSRDLPYRESANTDRAISPYAASKKSAELLCHAYHHLHGLDITVLRYFTVYGPAGRPDMLPFRLVQWISEGRPVIVYGDGAQSRDFTYVDDIARGTIAGLKPLGYQVINLGSDAPVIIMDAVRLVERLVNRGANIVHKPRHSADVTVTWADIHEASQRLDWRPVVTFAQGAEQLVRWYQANRTWASTIATE
jgi:nucleoside-diphosphate-sugar epimerase